MMKKTGKSSADGSPPPERQRKGTGSRGVKKYAVVDSEFHFVPSEVMRKVDETEFESKEGKAVQEWLRDPRKKPAVQRLQDIEGALRQMDECGVDTAMIMMPGWEMAGMDVCKILNNGLAKAARDYPGRFLPMAAVPYIDGQRSVDELDRVKNDLGLKGSRGPDEP